jgi:hypothetical protein
MGRNRKRSGLENRVMPTLLMRHHVRDFDAWKRVFLDEADTRRANGARGERLFRTSADPTEIWVMLEWDDLFRAELFVKSDDLSAALIRAGVIDSPDYWYLDDTDLVSP